MPRHIGATRIAVLFAASLCGLVPAAASAQDFSIHTRLYDLRQRPGSSDDARTGKGQLVGETFSLFHAGRVYDYLQQVDELTIFEPARQKFTIISNSRKVSTVLTFANIDNVLYRADKQARKNIEREADAELRKRIGAIRFLLEPAFEQSYSDRTHDLQLSSQYLTYDVQCAESELPERVEAYVRYADWTARLNYLLHPKSLLPGPRLALNAVLNEKALLPVEVELTSTMGTGLHMKAVHKYQWRLDANDRRKILYWDGLLASNDLKQVSFSEFQQALTAQYLSDKQIVIDRQKR